MATKKAAAKKALKSVAKKPNSRSSTPPSRQWSAKVNTDATHPEHELFNQDAKTVAEHLASRKVSPKGPASGMRMLNFYINRAGTNLPHERHAELEKAKKILSEIIAAQKSARAKPAMKKLMAEKSAVMKLRQKKTVTKKSA